MISIDYLSDLGLKGGSGNGSDASGGFNVILDYIVDATSTVVKVGDLVTFVGNNVKKASGLDKANGVALTEATVGQKANCQIYGIVNIPNHFIAGTYYFNNNGELTSVVSENPVGLAVTNSELLLEEGVFINV